MTPSFHVGGNEYKALKLDAFVQYRIVRRIGPVLKDLLPVIKDAKALAAKSPEQRSEDENLDAVAKFAGPIMEGFSKLSDADADYVLLALLSGAERKQGQGWARVAPNQNLMFSDLDLGAMLQIAARVFMHNLSNFFSVLPQS